MRKDETGCAEWDDNFLLEFPMPVAYDPDRDDPEFTYDDHPHISFELKPVALSKALGNPTAFVHYNVKVS